MTASYDLSRTFATVVADYIDLIKQHKEAAKLSTNFELDKHERGRFQQQLHSLMTQGLYAEALAACRLYFAHLSCDEFIDILNQAAYHTGISDRSLIEAYREKQAID